MSMNLTPMFLSLITLDLIFGLIASILIVWGFIILSKQNRRPLTPKEKEDLIKEQLGYEVKR